MRPCFLHCGPHKTGSTSIQMGLDLNADLLQAAGIHVPELPVGNSPTHSHIRLCSELTALVRHGLAGAPAWAELAKQIQKNPATPILSCEFFSTHFMKQVELDATISFFQSIGFRPHFVYFLRDQPSWLNSMYVQETKRFYTSVTFEEYLRTALETPRFNYRRMLLKQMGRQDADLTVIPFGHASRAGLLESLLKVIDPGLTEFSQRSAPLKNNPNAGAKAVYIGRQIAADLAMRKLNPRSNRGIFVAFKREYIKRDWHLDAYCGLDDQLAEKIEILHRESNNEIAYKLWGQTWAQVMQPIRKIEKNEFDLEKHAFWQHRDVRKVLKKLRRMVSDVEE